MSTKIGRESAFECTVGSAVIAIMGMALNHRTLAGTTNGMARTKTEQMRLVWRAN